ncbi:MAG: Gfo/Idh/MocA family oxidoreductase [Verrucomicrobiales bacterium]
MNQPTDKSAKTNGTSRRTFIASKSPPKSPRFPPIPTPGRRQLRAEGFAHRLRRARHRCRRPDAAQRRRQAVAIVDAFRDRLDGSYNQLQKDNAAKMDVPEERKFVGFDAYKHAIEVADVVLLTTPPGFRPIHFEAAVKAGKHVFMEKPVGTDSPGIRKVLETARLADEKGLKVVARHSRSGTTRIATSKRSSSSRLEPSAKSPPPSAIGTARACGRATASRT